MPHVPVVLKIVLFYASWLALPVAALLFWNLARGWHRTSNLIALLPVLVFVYARFVEPRVLLVSEHEVTLCGQGLPGTLRAGVVSDTHNGIFANAVSMRRIVDRLRRLDLDFVLMPGDFTYYPKPEAIAGNVEALRDVGVPVYAVMGNHDVGYPGPDLTEPLTAALQSVGVTVLNPGEAVFSEAGKYVRIAGLRDLYQVRGTDTPLEVPEPSPLPTIYLEHNPDTIKAGDLGTFDLMVSGHTHGGQINVPFFTCRMTFACDTLRYGYADNPVGKLFVTSGTGMVGLPVRFGVPPKVDVLNLRLDRCRTPEPRTRLTPRLGAHSTSSPRTKT